MQAFAENVLVCGGGSAVTGLGAAVVAEMQSVSTPSLQPTLCSCPDYMPEHTLKHSSWMGAAILSKVGSCWTLSADVGCAFTSHGLLKQYYPYYIPKLYSSCLQMVFQQNQHITKLDYDEAGPTVVHKKCS